MSSLPEISENQLRSAGDIEALCEISGEQVKMLYQSVAQSSNAVLTASRIAHQTVLENYNSNIPDSRQQGVLSTIFDLQQRLTALTGFSSVSLAAFNTRLAIFSCLSMVIKYHQKNKQQRNHIVMINGLPDVVEMAGQLNLGVRHSDVEHIAEMLDDQCAALVVSLPGIDDDVEYLESIREQLVQMDIPLYVDGTGQYLLLQNKTAEILKADILQLDLGYICGLNKGGNAILSNLKFSDYLPVPMADFNGETFFWNTVAGKPLSIGVLSGSSIDLQVALHCLIYLRMQGSDIQQQALQSMVAARYIEQRLHLKGIKTEGVARASGCCVIALENEMNINESLNQLLVALAELPIRLQTLSQNKCIRITLNNLHQLNLEQLHRLLELFILHHLNSLKQQD